MSIADYAQRLWDEAETKENPQSHRAPLAPVTDGANGLHVLEDIVEISIDKLVHFPTSRYNRYTLHTGEKMQELVDNIRCNGILMPLVVRELPQGYEIISGKNRREAARLLGYKVVPCIVRTLDDTEALCQLNFLNSEFRELRPSERAFAYQLEYEQKYHPRQDDTAPTDDTSRMTKYRYRQLCHFTLQPKALCEHSTAFSADMDGILRRFSKASPVIMAQSLATASAWSRAPVATENAPSFTIAIPFHHGSVGAMKIKTNSFAVGSPKVPTSPM